ncbi:unnamed protein product [Lota lota]
MRSGQNRSYFTKVGIRPMVFEKISRGNRERPALTTSLPVTNTTTTLPSLQAVPSAHGAEDANSRLETRLALHHRAAACLIAVPDSPPAAHGSSSSSQWERRPSWRGVDRQPISRLASGRMAFRVLWGGVKTLTCAEGDYRMS